jgi:two-component system response regulator HydG
VRKVNVRLIAATNRDLAAEAKAGRFREDLYYRLNVLGVKLPALRERGTDIRLLCEHFLHEAGTRSGRQRLSFSEEAAAALAKYAWPGNVRELRNLAERLAVLCPGEVVGLRDLPKEIQAQAPAVPFPDAKESETVPVPEAPPPVSASLQLADIERDHILRILTQCKGNKKQAAESLGIDRSTLYAKLRAYGIVGQS